MKWCDANLATLPSVEIRSMNGAGKEAFTFMKDSSKKSRKMKSVIKTFWTKVWPDDSPLSSSWRIGRPTALEPCGWTLWAVKHPTGIAVRSTSGPVRRCCALELMRPIISTKFELSPTGRTWKIFVSIIESWRIWRQQLKQWAHCSHLRVCVSVDVDGGGKGARLTVVQVQVAQWAAPRAERRGPSQRLSALDVDPQRRGVDHLRCHVGERKDLDHNVTVLLDKFKWITLNYIFSF